MVNAFLCPQCEHVTEFDVAFVPRVPAAHYSDTGPSPEEPARFDIQLDECEQCTYLLTALDLETLQSTLLEEQRCRR